MIAGGLRVRLLLFAVYAYFDHDKLYCYALNCFLWEYLQSIKIGINTGKAWGSLGWLNQSHSRLATQKPLLSRIIGSGGRRSRRGISLTGHWKELAS